MNTGTLCLKNITDSAKLTGQQNIDADIILPDYYDTIGKIIKCDVIPVTEALTINGDKISVAGIAEYSVIYLGENKQIYQYENSCKYTKVFQSKYAEGCVATVAAQSVFSLNCRAIGPKRIELRSVIQMNISIRTAEERVLISSVVDEAVISKNENLTYLSKINCISADISVSNSYSSKDFKESFDIVIRKSSKLKLTEIKTIHNKAYLKGIAETELIYFSKENCSIVSTILTTPVSEIIDIFGAEEDYDCNITFNDIYTDISIKNENSSDKTIEIRINANIIAEICRTTEGEVITDIYSTSDELISDNITADIVTSCHKVSKTESIIFETDIYDDNAYTINNCWMENIKISPEKKENRYALLVTATFNTILKDELGTFSVISREHTFETELLCNQQETMIDKLQANVLSVSANLSQNGKIRFTADVLIEAEINNICKVNAFTSIEKDSNSQMTKNAGYVIYFAKQDEEIWTIAKENRASIDKIKMLNKLSGEKMSEDKMLLLPSF